MADDTDPSVLDPAMTLGPDDPLRQWADSNIDWRTGRLLTQDPSAAIDSMIKRGIAPPSVHADGSSTMAYSDPGGAMGQDPADPDNIVRTNPDGTIAGNISDGSKAAPPAPPLPAPRIVPPTPKLASDGHPLDPVPDTPPEVATKTGTTEKDTSPKDGNGDTDVSAQKKPNKYADAFDGFSKSFAGVKAPTAPPLNAVGTPSVRSPSAVPPPNIANLIALTGGGGAGSRVLPTLAKLLVQGKA